jgi:hypothetical protein
MDISDIGGAVGTAIAGAATGGIVPLLGALLGGIARFGQAILEAREKAADRDHELAMTQLQGQLAIAADERKLRETALAGDIQLQAGDTQALIAALAQQGVSDTAAGGWAARLSSTVRPFVTYALMALYLAAKAQTIVAAGGVVAYGAADMALLGTILGFWFVDRGIRQRAPVHA